jgi:hypothetical protein
MHAGLSGHRGPPAFQQQSKQELGMKTCLSLVSLVLTFATVCAVPARAQMPELPRVYLDTTYPVQTGATHNVPAGGNIQAAIDAAVPGDTIVLQAGATYSQELTLKPKPNPTGKWIVIRSSSTAFESGGALQPGTRVNGTNPSHTSQLARIKSIGSNVPVFRTAWNAASPQTVSHYRLVGLEMMPADTALRLTTVVELGNASSTSVSASDIVVDRCYVHGLDNLSAGTSYRRGIAMNGARLSVIDSDVSNFHGDEEAQAIGLWNATGPIKIVNNFLEGAGENVMFGGESVAIPQAVPSDVEIRRNFMTKRDSWRNASTVVKKNVFELKSARRVLVDGNVMEKSWPGAQSTAIVLTPRNQWGDCTWCTIEDVTFSNNIVRFAPQAIQVLGTDYNFQSGQMNRVLFVNNLFDRIKATEFFPPPDESSKFLLIMDAPTNLRFEHNTIINYNASAVYFGLNGSPYSQPYAAGFVFKDNLIRRGLYGVFGSNTLEGQAVTDHAPGAVFVENAIAGVPAGAQSRYPAGNMFPSEAQYEAQFVNYNGGNGGDYHLVSGNIYAAAGNADIGADIDAINDAINNGGPPPPTETVLLADNFDDNSLAAAWVVNDLWSGFTDLAVPVNEANGRIEIGPIPNQADDSTYNGLSTNPYNFTNGYMQVRLAQAASSQAYSMFAVGINSSNYYRIFVFAGTLVCQKRIGGQKTELLTIAYDPGVHQFLRIEHSASTGKVVFMTAPNNLGSPGSWSVLHSAETWDTAAVPVGSVMFELKAGVSGPDASAGTAHFDDFKAARR